MGRILKDHSIREPECKLACFSIKDLQRDLCIFLTSFWFHQYRVQWWWICTLHLCGHCSHIWTTESAVVGYFLVNHSSKKTHMNFSVPSWNILGISVCMYLSSKSTSIDARISILCLRPMWFPLVSKPVRQVVSDTKKRWKKCLKEKWVLVVVSKLTSSNSQMDHLEVFVYFWREETLDESSHEILRIRSSR